MTTMTPKYEHLLAFVLDHPWAITKPMLETIAGILGRRMAGGKADPEDIQAAIANRQRLPQPTNGGAVGIIPVHGVLAPRANMMTEMSGATSYDVLTAQLREAVKTESIKTIVLDVDSPGGSVAGATEFAREVLKARTKKPIVAVANYTMASAAYWIASCATEIVAAPSAMVGSIGVFMMHDDLSKALEMEGVKRTYISAGKFKTEGNEAEPLSAEAEARKQRVVDDTLAVFHADIAKGRGVAIDKIRTDYGEGAVLKASEALSAGMVDRIGTMDDTLRRLASGERPSLSAAASMDDAELVADVSRVPERLWRARIDYALLETEL